MAEIWSGIVTKTEIESTAKCKSPSSLAARRRRMELRRVKSEEPTLEDRETKNKRLKLELPRDCDDTLENSSFLGEELVYELKNEKTVEPLPFSDRMDRCPRYGMTSVCGRRRDMEDEVAIHLSFCRNEDVDVPDMHYFGVYDGHGCSHVATRCRERLHDLVMEEVKNNEACMAWTSTMEQSFSRMDKEVTAWNERGSGSASCRCELRTPESDAVGSTAITAIITNNKIIVANCGDSRAVLCRAGKAVPLSTDHKPDRPDELIRIESMGGRVIYWDGPRVLGVLAMSRAIGDNYLKPYVICEPEVTETNRTAEDDCLILASDGLWDVVSNETACRVAWMCLKGNAASKEISIESCVTERDSASRVENSQNTDKACSDASMLLTKLALARRSTDNVSVVVINLRKDS